MSLQHLQLPGTATCLSTKLCTSNNYLSKTMLLSHDELKVLQRIESGVHQPQSTFLFVFNFSVPVINAMDLSHMSP